MSDASRTLYCVDFMVSRESRQVGDEKQVIEEFDRGCFVMMLENGSIGFCVMQMTLVKLDHILLGVDFGFLVRFMNHIIFPAIEWSSNPRSVFSRPTGYLLVLHDDQVAWYAD
jgi:hypothetical protein